MARGKANQGKAERVEPAGAKAYRHTRTGAIRHSTSKLGYPFEEVPKAELKEIEKEAEG